MKSTRALFIFIFSVAILFEDAYSCARELSMLTKYSKKSLEIEDSVEVVQQTFDPILRKTNSLYLPSRKIEEKEFGSSALFRFIDIMHKTMLEKSGVGIAANQIGKNLQIFIIEANANNPRYKVLGEVPYQVFINPKITAASHELKNFWHGCLSANCLDRGNVATYDWIEFESQDESGNLKRGRLEGFAAVVFQHELRHLLGQTYVDRATLFLSHEILQSKIEKGEENFFAPIDKSLPHLIGDYQIGESLEDYYQRQKLTP